MSEFGFLTSSEDISKTLSSRVTKERIIQGIDQKELARRADISLFAVRNFEQNGKITLDNLVCILRAIRKINSLENLFDFEKERIEVDAFEYLEKYQHKYNKKRVVSEKRK
jgi:predicted transcriptional regulator